MMPGVRISARFKLVGTRRSALLVSRKGTAVLRQEDLSQSGRAFVDGPCEGEGARVRGSMRLECSLGCRDNSGCGNVSEGVGFGTKKKVNKSLQTWPMKSVRKLSIIFCAAAFSFCKMLILPPCGRSKAM